MALATIRLSIIVVFQRRRKYERPDAAKSRPVQSVQKEGTYAAPYGWMKSESWTG